MDRIAIDRDELQIILAVWLAVAGTRYPASIRDLWTRNGEPRDMTKREAARDLLARYLVDQLEMSAYEVTRLPVIPHRGR